MFCGIKVPNWAQPKSQATLCICHARYTVTTTTTADSDSDADSLAEIQLQRATATDTATVENKIQFRDRHGEYYKCVGLKAKTNY